MSVDLYNAVVSDDPDELQRLLRSGSNANELYPDLTLISTKSILHMCCEKGRLECVQVLIDGGADLEIQDTWLQTPLMYSVITQYYEIADLLLSRDPSIVDIGDKYGKTALHIAVEGGSLECIEVLLRHGADVNVITIFGITPLMVACSSKELTQDAAVVLVKLLLDAGASCHMKCYRSRRTPLQMAIANKNVAAVELLLAADSDPNTTDTSGRCPISNLLWYHHGIDAKNDLDDDVMTIIIMLVQSGADLNLSKHEQSNALCMATRYRCTQLVEYFLAEGADQNSEYYCGITPLQIATSNRDLDTMKSLLNYNSNLYRKGRVIRASLDYHTDVFHLALDIGAFDAAILLEQSGYDMSRVDYLVDWSKNPPDTLSRNQPMLHYFRQKACSVRRLYTLCVLVIRETLPGNIAQNVQSLPLPNLLMKAVQMNTDFT